MWLQLCPLQLLLQLLIAGGLTCSSSSMKGQLVPSMCGRCACVQFAGGQWKWEGGVGLGVLSFGHPMAPPLPPQLLKTVEEVVCGALQFRQGMCHTCCSKGHCKGWCHQQQVTYCQVAAGCEAKGLA
jgi:hypothetical protein